MPDPLANGDPAPHAVAQAVELASQTKLLSGMLAALRSILQDVGVSDAVRRELVLESFPVAGAKRILAYRTGNGFDSLAVPLTPGVQVLPANEGRLGSAFINAGANPIVLYLAPYQRTGSPAVWLAANGGAWDGRFGQLTWCGNVWAVAQTGASTLVGGEV